MNPTTQATSHAFVLLILLAPATNGTMLPVGPGKPVKLEKVVPLYTGRPIGFGVGVMVVFPMTISGIPTDGKVAFRVMRGAADTGVA